MKTERLLPADRYLPCRQPSQDTSSTALSCKSHDSTLSTHSSTHPYHLQLMAPSPQRCLSFTRPPQPTSTLDLSSFTFAKDYSKFKEGAVQLRKQEMKKVRRMAAQQVVEAPRVVDNFYFNCIDMSAGGLLGVGLDRQCYLYSQQMCIEVSPSLDCLQQNQVTCVKFNRLGTLLYTGNSQGVVNVVDTQKLRKIRSFKNHLNRLGCIENTEDWGFLSGSKDKLVVHNDIRVKKTCVLSVLAHKEEVCGISVQNQTVASSGNDGRVNIWDIRNKHLFHSHKLYHSAVKALQWCPWKVDLLAAGGGSHDHSILFWNNQEQAVEKKFNGLSQVTGLRWREDTRDLITTHGKGVGIIWDLEKLCSKKILAGHSGRIQGLAEDRQGKGIWTLGADETLRFWKTSESKIPEMKQEDRINSLADFRLK